MVVSNTIYTPQSYVEQLTDKCYIINDNVIQTIHSILMQEGIESHDYPLWDYPLDEISEIVENELNVVLVDVSDFDENDEWVQEFRWFEVPMENWR